MSNLPRFGATCPSERARRGPVFNSLQGATDDSLTMLQRACVPQGDSHQLFLIPVLDKLRSAGPGSNEGSLRSYVIRRARRNAADNGPQYNYNSNARQGRDEARASQGFGKTRCKSSTVLT